MAAPSRRDMTGCLRRTELWIALAVVVFVWLMSNMPLVAAPAATNDDGTFVRGAGYILAGSWLGPYGNMTLAKGPIYSLWIAASWISGLPLLVSQAILYALSSLALVRAVRPWLRSETAAFVVFTLILFNPVTFSAPELRAVREGIYTPLTVLLLALLVWAVRWREAPLTRRVLLAMGIGVVLGLHWCTREEGVWILPAVLIAVASPLFLTGRCWRDRATLLREGRMVLTIAIAAFAVIGGVMAMNRIHYGIADVVDMKQDAFRDAYGAFVRIRADEAAAPYVIVSRAQRARAYAVSPAAAELRAHLEGPEVADLVDAGCRAHHLDPCDGELRAGWFVWGLRFAVERQGHYASGPTARAFYARLASEIDTACRDGRLSCLPSRRTLAPPFQWDFVPRTAAATSRALGYMIRQEALDVPRDATSCIVEDCAQSPRWTLFLDLVHSSALFVPSAPQDFARRGATDLPDRIGLDNYRQIAPEQRPLPFQFRSGLIVRVTTGLASVYRVVVPFVAAAAICAYLLLGVLGLLRRRIEPLFGVATMAALVVLTRVVLLAYLDVTSFPAINTLYLSPAYPALLLFSVAAILGLAFALRDRRASSAR